MSFYALCLGLCLGLSLPHLLSLVLRRWRFPFGDSSKEVYDQDDVLLNLRVASRWHNMGYWNVPLPSRVDGQSFAHANERLAMLVASNVQLREGMTILDVGFGNGESLRLWLDRFKPSRLYGMTSLPRQCEAARRLVGQNDTLIELMTGDAARDIPKLVRGRIDVITAIDCAYHFDSRSDFLRDAHRALTTNGRLAMTDICLASDRAYSMTERVLLRLTALGAGIPLCNLVTPAQYEASLRTIGFDEIRIEDITEHVFSPLADYIDAQDSQLGALLDRSKWSRMRYFAKVLKWLDGNGESSKRRLAFVLVTARAGSGELS